MQTFSDRPFTKRKINANTWVIEGVGCYTYLLLGRDAALLIDAGMSRNNLKNYVETITDLPVMGVLNTHGHFDHTGGNGWFEVAYMHPYAATEAKHAFDDATGFPLDYRIETVQDGQTFDLGGRKLEVLYLGSHNPGSIVIFDPSMRLAFTGDELESGQVLLMSMLTDELKPSQAVEIHLDNMLRLKSRMAAFDYICPSHNGTMIDKSYVDLFIEADQLIMGGEEGIRDLSSPTMPFPGHAFTRRFERNGANLCFDSRNIRAQK